MPYFLLLISIIVLVVLILKKVSPVIALLITSVLAGLLLGMPVKKIFTSINAGVGDTLGSTVMVIALGAMIGKIAEESGAAKKLVLVFSKWFGIKYIQWGILITGLLSGIPLFYNAGFVVLIPLVYAIAKTTKLPLLYVGLPMAASLSVTHGFLPPHPSPVAIASIFHASIGRVLLYGLILAIPTAIIAGVFFARLISKHAIGKTEFEINDLNEVQLPSSVKSFLLLLSPIVLIAVGTIGVYFSRGTWLQVFSFLQEPTIALLICLLFSILLLRLPIENAMSYCAEGVKTVALIILIIAAGGAFKQIIIDSHIGDGIQSFATSLNISPLVLGWLIAALFRILLGSATVAGLTASALVLPFIIHTSPELMVLSIGAGSLFCSHVNDTGFWMFKEYFGLSMKETFMTWTVMESIISIMGLVGVLILNIWI